MMASPQLPKYAAGAVPQGAAGMGAVHKPCALLRLMAARQGERITARDVVALQLAVSTLEHLAASQAKHFDVYRDVLTELVSERARADAMLNGLRALLEVHT